MSGKLTLISAPAGFGKTTPVSDWSFQVGCGLAGAPDANAHCRRRARRPEIFRVTNLMANEINGAKKVIIPDSAQMQNTEHPQTCSEVVLSFLDGLKKS